MRWLFILVLTMSQFAIADQPCEARFTEIAQKYSLQNGLNHQISTQLSDLSQGEGMGAVELYWEQMQYVGHKDLDQGSLEVRRQLNFQIPVHGSLGPSVLLSFISQGNYFCDDERILAYLGFEIQK